jgi:hypothetical protein
VSLRSKTRGVKRFPLVYRPCPCGGSGTALWADTRRGFAVFECSSCGGLYAVHVQRDGTLREIVGPAAGRHPVAA